jgi:hypothetical protein
MAQPPDDELGELLHVETEYREDGWPLCPRCGEDELYTLMPARQQARRPFLGRYFEHRFRCYLCSWAGLIMHPPFLPDWED